MAFVCQYRILPPDYCAVLCSPSVPYTRPNSFCLVKARHTIPTGLFVLQKYGNSALFRAPSRGNAGSDPVTGSFLVAGCTVQSNSRAIAEPTDQSSSPLRAPPGYFSKCWLISCMDLAMAPPALVKANERQPTAIRDRQDPDTNFVDMI